MHRRPKTLAQTVAYELREQILTRELKGGEPLTQDSIAEKFGASIIPVREALRQLAAEGLVELSAHKGATVTELTLSKVLEWIELRRIIELHLVDDAIDNMQDCHIEKAKECLIKYNGALNGHTDVELWSQYNWDFHAALYAAADKPETMRILSMLHGKSDRYVRLQLLTSDHVQRAQTEHLVILECCERRDKAGFRKVLEAHINGVAQDLIQTLEGRPELH